MCVLACAAVLQVVNPPACTALVSCQEFHLPLIECGLHLVNLITAPHQQALQGDGLQLHVSALLQREDRAALLWQAARWAGGRGHLAASPWIHCHNP